MPAANDAVLRPMRPEDVPEVLTLLEEAGLPACGVAEALEGFFVAEAGGRLAGVAGLERHGRDGLLRSVAVSPAWRGRGLGGALTLEILRMAEHEGLASVYLLTETAGEFFPRYGFQRIERSEACDAVRASAEFADLCPASSTVMRRSIGSIGNTQPTDKRPPGRALHQ